VLADGDLCRRGTESEAYEAAPGTPIICDAVVDGNYALYLYWCYPTVPVI